MSRNTRRAACGHAPDAGCRGASAPNATLFEVVIAPADGTRAASVGRRRLRYVCVFWAALGQAGACSYQMTWGAGRRAQWAGRKINAEHLLRVAQFANWSGGRLSEALRVQSSRLGHLGGGGAGASRGRADVSTADPANWCDRPNMCRDRSINAIHGAGNKEIRVCSSLRLHGDAHHVASMRLPGQKT
jgi:hypothetical protein